MNSHFCDSIHRSLQKILAPLVRILLRRRIPYSAVADVLKKVYIQQAAEHFTLPNKKMTTARISILTGLNRHDIAKISDNEMPVDEQHVSRAGRIIRMWIRDPNYSDDRGNPRALPEEGEISLMALIKKCAGDVPPKSMLEELITTSTITMNQQGHFKLTSGAFIPSDDFAAKMEVAAKAINELLHVIENNTQIHQSTPHFQRTLRYGKVPVEALEALRQWQSFHGQLMLERADAAFVDQIKETKDRNELSGKTSRVGLGMYYFEIPNEPLENSNSKSQTSKNEKKNHDRN